MITPIIYLLKRAPLQRLAGTLVAAIAMAATPLAIAQEAMPSMDMAVPKTAPASPAKKERSAEPSSTSTQAGPPPLRVQRPYAAHGHR